MISIVTVSHHEIYLYVTILSCQSLATQKFVNLKFMNVLWHFEKVKIIWKL
jgi:hypothetical protein